MVVVRNIDLKQITSTYEYSAMSDKCQRKIQSTTLKPNTFATIDGIAGLLSLSKPEWTANCTEQVIWFVHTVFPFFLTPRNVMHDIII